MTIRRDGDFGQLELGPLTAAEGVAAPHSTSLLAYFFVAVSAGVTVWLITRALDGKRGRSR